MGARSSDVARDGLHAARPIGGGVAVHRRAGQTSAIRSALTSRRAARCHGGDPRVAWVPWRGLRVSRRFGPLVSGRLADVGCYRAPRTRSIAAARVAPRRTERVGLARGRVVRRNRRHACRHRRHQGGPRRVMGRAAGEPDRPWRSSVNNVPVGETMSTSCHHYGWPRCQATQAVPARSKGHEAIWLPCREDSEGHPHRPVAVGVVGREMTPIERLGRVLRGNLR